MLKYPIQFWLLMSACFINSMAQMLTVFVSLFLHKHNFSIDNIGLIMGMFGLGGVVGSYISGVISDHINPLLISRVSMLCNALMIILLPLSISFSFPLIYIDIFLMGFFNSSFGPTALLLVLNYTYIATPRNLMSYRRVFVNLGGSVGVLISGTLFDYNPWLVFIVNAGLVLLAFIVLLLMRFDKPSTLNNSTATDAQNTYSLKLYVIILLFILGLIIYAQSQTIYSIYLADYFQINTTQLSILFSINCIMVILLQIPITYILRGISSYKLSAIGGLLMGCGFGVVVLNYGYWILIVSVLVWSLGELILFPSVFDIVTQSGNNKHQGKKMSLYQTAFAISSFVGPSSGAFMYHINPEMPWYICIILGIVLFLFFFILESKCK